MAGPGGRRDPPLRAEPAGRAPPHHRHRDRPAHRGATRRRRPGRIGPTSPERRRAAHRGRGTPAGHGHCQLVRTARPDRLSPTGVRWAHQRRCCAADRMRFRGYSGGAGFLGRSAGYRRASRTVPAAIRRAVVLRDGGCAFPGCSVPARWCDIHHIVHWVDHGPTSLENCVVLCGRHHRLLHHSHWRIEMADGIPEFHSPP